MQILFYFKNKYYLISAYLKLYSLISCLIKSYNIESTFVIDYSSINNNCIPKKISF